MNVHLHILFVFGLFSHQFSNNIQRVLAEDACSGLVKKSKRPVTSLVGRGDATVQVWGFMWPMKVSKAKRLFREPLGSNFRRAGCRIVILELSQSVGIHYGHE
ncbi:hypothetical protein AVEN_133281-1 [Araneus ventricosus]|uniref:Secreted protein n=1 Tax=Araneus ventricosus TaxID=182803 RepID=A0A4Y2DMW6_ARAVE|nr:hypothetical protein AVEN_133281-1 [Araneus ventricosus]